MSPHNFKEHAARWKSFGYGDALLPAAPPGATPSAESKIAKHDGKIPAKRLPDGTWQGLHWNDPSVKLTESLLDQCDGANLCMRTSAGLLANGLGLLGIDSDVEDPELAKIVKALVEERLGWAPCRTRGNSARALWLFRRKTTMGKSVATLKRDGKPVGAVEFLADGQHFVIEGVHKSGASLKWDTIVQPETLTPVTEAKVAEFVEALTEAMELHGVTVEHRASAAAKERSAGADLPRPGVNPESARERAINYLSRLDPAQEGERNNLAYKAAAWLRDFGVVEPEAFELMTEHWRCEPPLEDAELRATVESAYRRARNQPGSAAPETYFPVLEPEAPSADEGKRKHRFTVEEGRPELDTSPHLVEDLLQAGKLAVMSGAPKVGKSFEALDMGLAIARGVPFHGLETERGAVIYFVGEGASGMRHRILAYGKHHSVKLDDVPLYRVGAANLGSKADVGEVLKLIEDVRERSGLPVRLCIFDTLARCIPGLDENSASDFNKVVDHCALIQATGASVLLVAHTGKTSERGVRGSSALAGAWDSWFLVEDNVLIVKQQKDLEDGQRLGFRLVRVALGANERGKEISSAVAVPEVEAGFALAWCGPETGPGQVLERLAGIEADEGWPKGGWIPFGALRGACEHIEPKNRGRKVVDALEALIGSQQVEMLNHQPGRPLTEKYLKAGHFRPAARGVLQ